MKTVPTDVLRRPIVSEKSTNLKQTVNQVVFEVKNDSTKSEIKSAVETAFKVKVMRVNTMLVRGKLKTVGRYAGKRSNWKKAIVTLKQGDNIDVAEGV